MLESILLGKLSLNAIPHNPIILGAGAFMALIGVMIVAALFYFKKWTWLWRDWITTVDHKKIGVMYIILAFVMLLRGFTDAIMMRLQQVMAVSGSAGYLEPEHYDQIFTAHGVIMIFFMAMPFMFGLINIVLPLQIGARDVAYPFLNSLSFWLAVAGAMLMNVSLVVGDFAATGWLAYPPLSELTYSPGVGVDYYIWALQVSGVGSLLSGINFIVTVLKMRCPGMTLMRMPVFAWTALCAMLLVVLSFPVLTATLFLLSLDRLMGMHFFTADFGGNAMMYINMIWIWGHPEVYILILPSFGIFSEIVATFCKKKLFGYNTMVWATASITVLSFIVWLHHFFTMGAGANVNAFFGIATMVIAIPTGAKVFNWLFTMFRGRITYTAPMIWTLGFMSTFVIGGMTGVLMAIPAVDFQFHNSLFLVAHFHNVIIGGVVFGYIAGLTYWFPKVFGFTLNDRLGKIAAWLWIGGFYVAFMPIYVMGLMGVTRRLNYYYDGPEGWYPLIVMATIGAVMIGLGVFTQVVQILVSIRDRKALRDVTGDPWNARTLEWSIPSPVPFYNFAITPEVDCLDAFWEDKQRGVTKPEMPEYQPIHMPRNTGVGFVLGALGFVLGFAFTWHIYWLIAASLLGIVSVMIIRSFNLDTDYYVTSEEVTKTELQYTQVRA